MKAFFLTLLGLLLSIAIVRFSYGLQANEVQYFIQVMLDLPPDIKGEFQIVISAAEAFSDSLAKLKQVSGSGKDILDVVKTFFESVAAFMNIPFTFFQFLMALLEHLVKSLRAIFNLLFGPAVVPID